MTADEKGFISVYRTLTDENKRRLLCFFSDLLSKRPPLDKTADCGIISDETNEKATVEV
mgnify:FL=1